MKRSQFLYLGAALTVSFLLVACGGKDSPITPPASNARTVKYEITGNYTGGLVIVYTGASGAPITTETFTLPWTRDITIASDVGGIGFTGNTLIGRNGVVGQTATIRIYSGGTVVKTEVGTVLSSGLLQLPTLAHVFP